MGWWDLHIPISKKTEMPNSTPPNNPFPFIMDILPNNPESTC